MHIPQPIISEIKTALTEHLGRPPGPLAATPVGGGCISPAARVRSAAGDVVFLKWSEPGRGPGPGIFEAEARAL